MTLIQLNRPAHEPGGVIKKPIVFQGFFGFLGKYLGEYAVNRNAGESKNDAYHNISAPAGVPLEAAVAWCFHPQLRA